MIMQSQKMVVNSICTTQQQRLLKDRSLFSFNLYKLAFGIIIVMVVFSLSMASAKPTNLACTETQWWVHHEDGSISCEDCPSCHPGRTLSPECGKRVPSSAMVKCVLCPSGISFSSKRDTSSCTPCSSCSKDQVVLRNCTSQWDIKCEKRCYSKDRYYDDDKGDCFACSRCCGDDQDVVEEECKGKFGAGSNMICSFHSSVNRCEKSTTSPQTPTTIINQFTTANDYTNPSQGSTREYIVPPTTQSTRSLRLSQRKDLDFWTAASIPVVILVLLVCCGCFYFFKKRQVDSSFWCNDYRDAESRNHYSVTWAQHPLDKKATGGEAKVTLMKHNTFYRLETISPESKEPLLKEGDPGILTCTCERETKEDSKLLSSLLQYECDLETICECLDTTIRGLGHYRAVALYYGFNHYKISSVLEKHNEAGGGPSRTLIEWLAAAKPELTVREFVTVVRKEAQRNDVVNLLEKYDADVKKEMHKMRIFGALQQPCT